MNKIERYKAYNIMLEDYAQRQFLIGDFDDRERSEYNAGFCKYLSYRMERGDPLAKVYFKNLPELKDQGCRQQYEVVANYYISTDYYWPPGRLDERVAALERAMKALFKSCSIFEKIYITIAFKW